MHFHLRRGGVSTVMRAQAACLAERESVRVAFIAGAHPDSECPVPLSIVPGLDYDSFTGASRANLEAGAAALASSIQEAIHDLFPNGCDLLHVHNPLLRKNARLLGALRILRAKGLPLLVQEHDFAEDFRPDVYDSHWPYPDSCDYATINRRDRDFLISAGLDPRSVHLLPNPIGESGFFIPRGITSEEIAAGRSIALYPVRAIKRKNVGEALLLSHFLPKGATLVVTLPPTSPGDMAQYKSWKARAAEKGMPVRFDEGKSASLSKLYEDSFVVLSTSVKEGFGYSFLEPIVRGLQIVGREIPHIAGDFRERGIAFDGLYGSIRVPAELIDTRRLRAIASSKIARMRESFGPAFSARVDGTGSSERLEARLRDLESRFEGDGVDFGSLDAESQADLLDRISRDDAIISRLADMNPFLDGLFEPLSDLIELEKRRDAVLAGYSNRAYAELLIAAYEATAARESTGAIDKATLVERYLVPDEFFLSAC